ncbi:hypothetical protein HMPREF0693_0761 [Proteus mirabilis ATCC 29906]|nr:hypothetical protein HMPREF0693_0761 [Proteus mirabilis ATCC 29906]KXB99111.1 hypothetical protein HMPREF3203_03531 [Proteus mirabilis]
MVVMASDVVVVKVNTEDNTTMAIMNIVVMVKEAITKKVMANVANRVSKVMSIMIMPNMAVVTVKNSKSMVNDMAEVVVLVKEKEEAKVVN